MSQDSTAKKPTTWATDDHFKPADAFDVSDENPQVIASLLRSVIAEMRSGFEMLREEMRSERKARESVVDRVDELERITPLRRKAIKK
jgi:hypothetical protein